MKIQDRVLIKLDSMNTYLNELEEMLPQNEDDFLSNLTIRRACQKTIENAIEEVIDILSILVSSLKLGLPESEDDIVHIAEKNKIIDKETALKVKNMKGFRNILVHKYGEIDDSQTYEFLSHEIDDFQNFETAINSYLKKYQKIKK
ncbi:DUF86 domain-containing protein [Candidatus Woesearchaeota archaeon]|nr:DUF86 domain-containing protein [Candidatus Woesearchaeota archaeon]